MSLALLTPDHESDPSVGGDDADVEVEGIFWSV